MEFDLIFDSNNNITRTVVDELYHLNVLTTLIQMKDNSLCPFIRIFDPLTWAFTFLWTIMVMIIFHKLFNKNNKIKWQYYATDIWISLIGCPSKILVKRKFIKNDKILMSVWILMSMIISKLFSGVLLSSFVNIKIDLVVKSFQDLINKPSIEIFYEEYFKTFLDKQGSIETLLLSMRIKNENLHSLSNPSFQDDYYIKLKNGRAIILCNTYICQFHQLSNPHLHLVFTNDHYVQSFASVTMRKSHSHLKQITKL